MREGQDIKLRHGVYAIIFLLLLAAYTVPSDEDYHSYLRQEQGIKCMVSELDCLPGAKSASSEHIRNAIVYMKAETKLQDGGSISVVGIFNHFFVMENNLN